MNFFHPLLNLWWLCLTYHLLPSKPQRTALPRCLKYFLANSDGILALLSALETYDGCMAIMKKGL
uniref:Uncharacterized protein n=1 Tax=Rhizophora mucronata TaxID=61149 RepID=A0A2P2NP77_RHIMU